MRRLGVDPEPKRDADRVGARARKHDRAVDSAAHRHRGARRGRGRAEDGADRRREGLDGELVSADRSRLEQRQAAKALVEPVGVGVRDHVAVDA